MNTLNRCCTRPSVQTFDLSKMIDDLFNDPTFRVAGGTTASTGTFALDVLEDAAAYTVVANLPGFTKDQIEISAHEGVLTITAKHPQPAAQAEGAAPDQPAAHYLRRERRVGTFTRSLSLPADFVEDQTSAELKDGVLTVRLPKSPKNTPRKISVN